MRRILPIAVMVCLACLASGQRTYSSKESNAVQGGSAAIVYSEGGAFQIEGPKGWTTDRDTGQRYGVCCVYYPEGTTWDDAETVMYPNIATKGPRQKTLQEFMDSDMADFREHNSEMTYEDSEDIPLKNKRVAKLRLFYNVNQGSSEAVAYVDEEKIIALFVVSSKTQKGLDTTIPLLRSVLQSYAYMDVRSANGVNQGKTHSFELPKN